MALEQAPKTKARLKDEIRRIARNTLAPLSIGLAANLIVAATADASTTPSGGAEISTIGNTSPDGGVTITKARKAPARPIPPLIEKQTQVLQNRVRHDKSVPFVNNLMTEWKTRSGESDFDRRTFDPLRIDGGGQEYLGWVLLTKQDMEQHSLAHAIVRVILPPFGSLPGVGLPVETDRAVLHYDDGHAAATILGQSTVVGETEPVHLSGVSY